MRRYGVHTSIQGGLWCSLKRADALGCSSVQIFSHNPRSWAVNEISKKEINLFKELRKKLDISPSYIHCSYLINIASPNRDIWKKSLWLLIEEMRRADSIGADYVVLHIGSSSGDISGGRKRAIEGLKGVGGFSSRLLLENTSGERGDIASTIEEIAALIDASQGIVSGICFDTCHAFQAGYDITTPKGIDSVIREIDKYIGKGGVRLIHLNDSKFDIASHRDRHEHLGRGKIGIKLKAFINHERFKDVPIILETPKKTELDDKMNLKILRQWIGNG